ncbi:MAG: flagellar basal body P-ring protein FlgI [Oceanospirillaceae bacterium]|jgi:flagellar P-ring protein precursor FlgI|nr:flagellar basal body P-ring protein FlgI [Oceanospirillaceae bacterium]MBT6078206.1 flagellar basal body P-ring protein FlgI [Oceanospirillaceae bacterium]MBT7329487.1 flagellar basal body P-ring protein FlgI [Oceanospirillaceae bacterium]
MRFCRIFAVLAAVLAANVAIFAHADRVKDLAEVAGVRDNQLIGYGLVVGLNGTGDGKMSFTSQSMTSMLARFGVNLSDTLSNYDGTTTRNALELKNVAAVMITANLPAFTKPGQRIDVTVSTIGAATSLRGGSLIMSRLLGVDGEVYALAQGALAVSGASAGGAGTTATVNVPTVGRVPSGATVEKMVQTPFSTSEYLVLNLKNSDFTTNRRLANAINDTFGLGTAEALDAVSTRILAPADTTQRVAFVSMIENLEVEPAAPPARVVVNSRTGTVVISRNVKVDAAAVTHGGITVTVKTNNEVSQANALAQNGETLPVANADVAIDEATNNMFLFTPGIELQDIVDAVNAVGATPSALVSILQALKQSGSLRADLIVI